jgi:hypothetical protein
MIALVHLAEFFGWRNVSTTAPYRQYSIPPCYRRVRTDIMVELPLDYVSNGALEKSVVSGGLSASHAFSVGLACCRWLSFTAKIFMAQRCQRYVMSLSAAASIAICSLLYCRARLPISPSSDELIKYSLSEKCDSYRPGERAALLAQHDNYRSSRRLLRKRGFGRPQ